MQEITRASFTMAGYEADGTRRKALQQGSQSTRHYREHQTNEEYFLVSYPFTVLFYLIILVLLLLFIRSQILTFVPHRFRASGGPMMVASSEGGMDIEGVRIKCDKNYKI